MRNLKSLSLILLLFTLTACSSNKQKTVDLLAAAPLIVYDQPVTNKQLKNYRNSSRYRLNASASGQFSAAGLAEIISHAHQKVPIEQIIIVDLRQEPHGFINHGIPISWYGFRNQYNLNKTTEQIVTEEKSLLSAIKTVKHIKIHNFKKTLSGEIQSKNMQEVVIESVYNEADLVKEYGVKYQRFFVLDHHRPTDLEVDEFVKFTKNLPAQIWLHFHCRGGVGRATTFMTMYDMIRNATKIPMADIIKRQQIILGAVRDKEGTDRSEVITKPWKITPAMERKHFIQQFYKYIIDPNGYAKYSWSEWLNKR